MLPRGEVEQRRHLAKFRKEISVAMLLRVLNSEFEAFGKRADPRRPLEALEIVRQLAGKKQVFPIDTTGENTPEDENAARLLTTLNQILRRYMSAPYVSSISPEGVWFRGRAQSMHRKFEELSISKMIDLAECGELDRLRSCNRCSRWFFAKQPDQACCHKTCGQELIKSDRGKRDARNATRRNTYASAKRQEAAQKIANPWPRDWTSATEQKENDNERRNRSS